MAEFQIKVNKKHRVVLVDCNKLSLAALVVKLGRHNSGRIRIEIGRQEKVNKKVCCKQPEVSQSQTTSAIQSPVP